MPTPPSASTQWGAQPPDLQTASQLADNHRVGLLSRWAVTTGCTPDHLVHGEPAGQQTDIPSAHLVPGLGQHLVDLRSQAQANAAAVGHHELEHGARVFRAAGWTVPAGSTAAGSG